MVHVIFGTTNKPVSSDLLRQFFQSADDYNGFLYIGYPIIGTAEGPFSIDALWISPDKGIVIFNLVEGKNVKDYEAYQDDCINKMEAKLRGSTAHEPPSPMHRCMRCDLCSGHTSSIGDKLGLSIMHESRDASHSTGQTIVA